MLPLVSELRDLPAGQRSGGVPVGGGLAADAQPLRAVARRAQGRHQEEVPRAG